MNIHIHKIRFLFLLSLAAVTSCKQYATPQAELLGERFTEANTAAMEEQFRNIPLLTLDMAKKFSVENNQSLEASFLAVDAARMRYYQSLGAYAPTFRLTNDVMGAASHASGVHNPPMDLAGTANGFQSQTGIKASYLLFDGLARYFSTRIAQSSWKMSEAEAMKVRCLVKRAAAYAYFDIQYATKLIEIQQNNKEFQLQQQTLVTSEMPPAGKRHEDELLNFLILKESAQAAIIEAENQRLTAGYALAQLLGCPSGKLPQNVDFEPIPQELQRLYYNVDMCLEIALENNPDMHIMQQQLRIAEYQKYKTYSAFLPTATFHTGYGNTYVNNSYGDYHVDRRRFANNEFTYGVTTEYILFDGLARYQAVRAARAAESSAQFAMAATYLQVVNDIRSAYENYDAAFAQFGIYQSILNAALRQRDLVRERYNVYDDSVDRITRVQSDWVTVQTQTAAAATTCRKAIAQLEAIMMIDL